MRKSNVSVRDEQKKLELGSTTSDGRSAEVTPSASTAAATPQRSTRRGTQVAESQKCRAETDEAIGGHSLRGKGDRGHSNLSRSVELFPSAQESIRWVPLAHIRLSPQAWTCRESVNADDVERFAEQLRKSGRVEVPIIVRFREGGYDVVDGWVRCLAAERAGWSQVPVVEREGTELELLQAALTTEFARSTKKQLPRAWALARFLDLLREAGLPHRQVDLARRIGARETDLSSDLKAARLIPKSKVEQAAHEVAPKQVGDVLARVGDLKRPIVRRLTAILDEAERFGALVRIAEAVLRGEDLMCAIKSPSASASDTDVGVPFAIKSMAGGGITIELRGAPSTWEPEKAADFLVALHPIVSLLQERAAEQCEKVRPAKFWSRIWARISSVFGGLV
jgi:ParB-like chromosome segregation protein Spo0J